MPPQPQKSPSDKPGQKEAIAGLIALAVAIAAPLAARWEGYSGKVYKDPGGIPTYCYGETENVSKDPTRVYAKTECMALLRQRMAHDYAPKVIACLPELVEMDARRSQHIFAALIDGSYNAGPAGICRSPMAAHVRAGNLQMACSQQVWTSWYVTMRYYGSKRPAAAMQRAGWVWVSGAWRKRLPGLVNRRADEARVCRAGLVA